MKKIYLPSFKVYTLVDDEDLEILSKHTWGMYHGYVQRSYMVGRNPINGKQINRSCTIHRVVMNAPKGTMIDHINGDKLDNRKINLRLCTNAQNQWNRGATRTSKTGFKGVYYCKRDKKWIARLGYMGKYFNLGSYTTALEAAKAYNGEVPKYHGEFGYLNKV